MILKPQHKTDEVEINQQITELYKDIPIVKIDYERPAILSWFFFNGTEWEMTDKPRDGK